MTIHRLLLSFMGGSLVKAAARDGPDWDPWMPLPQGDRWMLIYQMSLEIIKLIFWVLIRIGLIILCSQRKEPWYGMPLLPVCRQSRSLLGP